VKITNLKTIYLTGQELKDALIKYLFAAEQRGLAEHLRLNECTMEWANGEEFVISIDGEYEHDTRTTK
jgi:hypothetical protein